MNLYHIWGDDNVGCSGSDYVADTPNQGGPNTGTPVFPSMSCANGPNGDLFMNYMDYVDDAAMYMFTIGQVARMQATLDDIRANMGRGPYGRFIEHTGTPLTRGEDSNGSFAVADDDADGVADLYFIKRRNTGTGTIEVHILSGLSNFQTFIQHSSSALAQAEDGNGDFLIGDFDRDGTPDLFFIKRRNTGTNSIEVHILSGASGYQQFLLQTGTPLTQGEDSNGDFLLGDFDRDGIPDLYFIKRRNTGTNSIEVHVLTGASNYQQFACHTGTPLAQAEDANGDYAVADYNRDGIGDLWFIKRRNTGTTTVEVHVFSAATGFQQNLVQIGSSLSEVEDSNGDFFVGDYDRDGIPDLYFVKRRNTGTETIEVHILRGRP